MKKQFDLQYYLEHPETKVVTRRGYNVRIICTDAMSTAGYNVVGLVSYDGTEKVFKFTPDGLML